MEIERKTDAAARIVVLEVAGDLDDAGLLALADELAATPGLEADFSLLIDLRQARGQEVTTAGVSALATRNLVLAPAARRAVVAPTPLGFGMSRMYELLRSERGGATRVFRDYDQARRWAESGDG